MSEMEFYSDGFDEFSKLLEEYSKKTSESNVLDVLEYGAKEFVKDVKALPKPRSLISKGGYTHLIDTVTTRRAEKEVETGWGKYYGIMVEKGTRKMNAQPHMKITYERNADKYHKLMNKKLFG